MHLASASGNVFGYFWADEVPAPFEGGAWARALCPRGLGFGLDGIFLLHRPEPGEPWNMEHWDVDGSHTFCSNGTRAALAVAGAPEAPALRVRSSGLSCDLRQGPEGVGLRMPEGEGFGLHEVPFPTPFPAGFGFIGNPQLVLRVPSVASIDLSLLAPPLRGHAALPGGTNVNIVEVLGPGRARIRSWERGVESETLCCGTGCGVTAAWLARTEGQAHWELETASGDPVTVDLDPSPEQGWRDLWVAGRVRRLGVTEPDASFGL